MTREDFFTRLRVSVRHLSPTKCWKWNMEQGRHSRVSIKGVSVPVRRAIYQHLLDMGFPLDGPLEHDRPLVNTCGESTCLNPHHMAPASSARCLMAQGKPGVLADDPRGAHLRERTHCPSGHPYDLTNTLVDRSGRRRCRACNRLRNSWRNQLIRTVRLLEEQSRRALRPSRDPTAGPTFEDLHEPPESIDTCDYDGDKRDVCALV